MTRRSLLTGLAALAALAPLGCLRRPGWEERHHRRAQEAWERRRRQREMERAVRRGHEARLYQPDGAGKYRWGAERRAEQRRAGLAPRPMRPREVS